MKQEPIIIKVSKEKQATYQSNTHDFETLRYEEVGKPWWVNTKRELVEFLEKADQVLKSKVQVVVFNWQRFTNAFLVKKVIRMIGVCLIVAKDILYVAYILLTSIPLFLFHVLAGAFQSPSRNTRRTSSTTKHYEPPVDDEWWRKSSKPQASKKTRTIRVVVEVEDFES
jgi:hypothetical protein